MSDRQLFDRSAAIPRGRYEARVILDRTPTGSGPGAARMGNPTPLARMGKGGFEVTQGADAMHSARSMGMKTAPVAMSMSSWRKAGAAGMIAGSGSVANFARKAEITRSGGAASIAIVVDLRDFEKLARSYQGISVAIRQGHIIVSRAINDGLRTLKTGVRRKLKLWTGIKSYAETEKGMRFIHSTPATMTGALVITDRHRRIGANFGAKWSRANPGGTHSAWNRSQLAPHTFMGPGGILYKGTGKYNAKSGRNNGIAPMWGPNMAREVERHKAEVERDVVVVVQTKVQTAAVRMLSNAIAKGRR